MKNASVRELNNAELELLEKIDEKRMEIAKLVTELELLSDDQRSEARPEKRWLAIARTDLQKGFMSLTRAVTKPEKF